MDPCNIKRRGGDRHDHSAVCEDILVLCHVGFAFVVLERKTET